MDVNRRVLGYQKGWVMLITNKISSCERGFTLVELLITVAVFAVLTMLALPSFNQWIANSKIRSTTESVLAGFQLARAEAVRLNRGVRVTLNADTSWTVAEVLSGTVIQTRPATEGTGNTTMTITPGTATTVDFNGLGRVTNLTPITQIDLDSTSIPAAETKELRIMINTGGTARACDPSHPASDPRGC
jgi:type IV fimbrial biogenesis protein FimT